jgi:drug/metabolite transporter (DMT)-like permease
MTPPSNPSRPGRATLLAFGGVVLIGGLNALGVRKTVSSLAPCGGATIRFAFAALILVGLVIVTRRPFPRGRSLWGAALYGIVGFAASYGLLYTALQDVPAGTATVLLALTPLMTLGLAVAHRQEQFHVQGLIGGLIALGGVAIVFADQIEANVPPIGLGMVVLGTLCVAEAGVILKWIPKSDPFSTNAVAMATGVIILGALSVLAGDPRTIPALPETWLAIAYLVVLGSVVLFSLYVFTLQRWTASAVSYSTLLFPFVGVTAATIAFGERFSPALLVGGVVALVGVYVGALRPRPARSSATSSPECLPIDNCLPDVPLPVASRT